MNDKVVSIIFLTGAAIGFGAGWILAKRKYEQIANDEIAQVKAVYYEKRDAIKFIDENYDKFQNPVKVDQKQVDPDEETMEPIENDPTEPNEHGESYTEEMKRYADILDKSKYARNWAEDVAKNGVYGPFEEPRPYVIAPAEIGELDYPVVEFTYYNNEVLVDEDNEVVEQDSIYYHLGEALEHFGDFEEDSVCVRDDRLKVDYMILQDMRDFYPKDHPIAQQIREEEGNA